MILNGTQFNCEVIDILNELKSQLSANGVQRFAKMFDSGDNIMVCCPYHKNGQERRPSAGVRKSDGTLHCFDGDTEIITSKGIKRIGELVDTEVDILNGNGNWETVTVKDYGKSLIWKLTLERDGRHKEILTTQDHKWFVKGLHKPYTTENLKRGWYLESLICDAKPFKLSIEGIIHGIIYGDGTRHVQYVSHRVEKTKRIRDKANPIGVTYTVDIPKFTKKTNLLKYFKTSHWHIGNLCKNGGDYWCVQSHRLPLNHNLKKLPSVLCNRDYLMSFLAGYFACDGSYDLMTIYSSKISELKQVRDLCVRCGVSTTEVIKTVRDTNYTKNAEGGNLYIYPKSLPKEFYLVDTPKITKYSRSRWRVKSIEPTTVVKHVYCCQTSTHSFVLADNILTHNCLMCDKTVGLDEMIANCFGYSDPIWGYRWLIKNFATVEVEEREDIKIDFQRNVFPNKSSLLGDSDTDKLLCVSEEELDSYRYTHPYVYKRGVTDAVIEAFDIGYDKKSDSITFPVRDKDGNCLFVAKRTVKFKRFDLPKNIDKPLYGLYETYKNIELGADTSEIYVCEGLFDCLRLWSNGIPAVAGFGCLFSEYQIKQLEELPVRKLILALDSDDAGRKATEKLKKRIKHKLITEVVLPKGRKDIGECTDEEIKTLQEVW